MPAHTITRKTTPQIIYTGMSDDTHPVFIKDHPGAGYGITGDAHVSPGIPEDTSIKTQVPAPQWVASSMSGKG
jgi:hypothetical protein